MDDHKTAARPWRPGLLHDLQRALFRLEAERPVADTDAEVIARWALLTADVCSAIAELSEPCAGPAGGKEPLPLHGAP